MENDLEIKKQPKYRFKKPVLFTLTALLAAYVLLLIIRIPHAMEAMLTKETVDKIRATKLTLGDVMGENLPPDPGEAADDTIEGIDANKNGIRDDVELAIFKEYPNSPKIRAALLQYAMALQTQMTLKLVNPDTATESVKNNESRARVCLWELSSRNDMDKFLADMEMYENFIKDRQIDTPLRTNYLSEFYGDVRSFTLSNEGCDIDMKTLNI